MKLSIPTRLHRGAWLVGVTGTVAIGVLIAWSKTDNVHAGSTTLRRVTIATPAQPGPGNVHVALADRLFEKQGVEAVREPVASGMRALDALLQRRADLAVVADTPIVMNTLDGQKLFIIATIYESRKGLAILARGDRGIERPGDLAGKRIGVTFGTNAQFFLDTMLLVHGVPEKKATIINVASEDLVSSVKNGDVDAVTVFNPHLANLAADRSFSHRSFYGEELYKFRFNLVATQAYAKANQQVLDAVVASLVKASDVIRAEPVRARKIISQASNTDDAVISTIFNPNDYDVHLDQSLLLALEDQSRWAIRRKLVRAATPPDYLDHVDMGPLTRIDPSAVTIIR